MARRVITLDEKIEKAEAAVQAAKVKYDAALDTLEKLVTKRKELDDKRLLEAYHSSGKSVDEIISFLQSSEEADEPKKMPGRASKKR
ncbi:MAG: hypothetical protein K6F00_05575 [Lachnospiraceae bacterium]|nr:hypothetical protein [Lachnospiraceae bacterium]